MKTFKLTGKNVNLHQNNRICLLGSVDGTNDSIRIKTQTGL